MSRLYKFFGGRKLYYFNLLLFINLILVSFTVKWTSEFGYFCIFLYSAVVIGVEGERFIKCKVDNAKE